MVHKASVVYMIPIIILLLFASKVVFANFSENPKHYDVEKMISRSRLLMEIIPTMKVAVPKGTMLSGSGKSPSHPSHN
ncbi:hypothetical protein DVH24_027734 [Malus domestica]|uniref:Transmembrane protein n=1 Tax=Malus domestica TaxID=3750 RepID=A0A498HE53_MALDO|nr:hypothetical protein DVH24_027734 [Malus domestica]